MKINTLIFSVIVCCLSSNIFAELPFDDPEALDQNAYIVYQGKKIYIYSFFARIDGDAHKAQNGAVYLPREEYYYNIFLTDRVNIKCYRIAGDGNTVLEPEIYSSEKFNKLKNKELFMSDGKTNQASFFYYDSTHDALWFYIQIIENKDISMGQDMALLKDGFFGFWNVSGKYFRFIDTDIIRKKDYIPYIYKMGLIRINYYDRLLILTTEDQRIWYVKYPIRGSKAFLYKYWESKMEPIEIKFDKTK